jgi:transposase
VTQELLPKLLPAYMIVMDHATFHPRQDIQTASANAGHTLEYLPSYSPDFNDIEPKWAQAKAFRKREGCSIAQLFAAYAFLIIFMRSTILAILQKKKFCMASTIKLLPCSREFCAYAGR